MKLFAESKLNEDKNTIFFHGSAKPLMRKLDAPSFEHPFFVTADLYFANIFAQMRKLATGNYDYEVKFTEPGDDTYIYVVSVSRDIEIIDLAEKKDYDTVLQTFPPIVSKVFSLSDDNYRFNTAKHKGSRANMYSLYTDIREFMHLVLSRCAPGTPEKLTAKHNEEAGKSRWMRPWTSRDYWNDFYDVVNRTIGMYIERKVTPQELQDSYKDLAANPTYVKYAAEYLSNPDNVHKFMADSLRKLNAQGYSGMYATDSEHDPDIDFSRETSRSLGIWDVKGLDLISIVPMKYKFVKKIRKNIDWNELPEKQIRRYIELYQKIAK